MYTKKFAGKTLDETLKAIKMEMGPEAIILKTVTNKGPKRLTKNRVEITAAVTEKDYLKKARVDKAVGTDKKEDFYKNKSSYVSQMIDDYNNVGPKTQTPPRSESKNYGALSLNRAVKTNGNDSISQKLNDFLGEGKDLTPLHNHTIIGPPVTLPTNEDNKKGKVIDHAITHDQNVKHLEMKVDDLYKRVDELVDYLSERTVGKQQDEISRIISSLHTMRFNEKLIRDLNKKIYFQLNEKERDNVDCVKDFILREFNQIINTKLPLFSSVSVQNQPVITVLISQGQSGQTSSMLKMYSLKPNTKLVSLQKNKQEEFSLAQKLLNTKICYVEKLSSLVTEIRKAVSDNLNVMIDLTTLENDVVEIVNSIKSAFYNVEVLMTLSAAFDEKINSEFLKKYSNIIDGINLTSLDKCIDYIGIFNLIYSFPEIPLKMFSIGPTIPNDIEDASVERLLSKIICYT